VFQQRAVRASADDSGGLAEVHVAGGTATLVSLDVPLGPGGPRLEDAHGLVRLVPVDGSSFLILPAADLPEGERLLLFVPLERGASLTLALISVRDEVDTQVELLLQDSDLLAGGLGDVARLLNTSRTEPVELVLTGKRLLKSGDTCVRLKSVLRLDHHVFVSFLFWAERPSADARKQVLFRAVMEDGSVVALPVLRVSTVSSVSPARQYTFVSVLPEGARHLEVAVRGEGVAEDMLSIPLVRVRPTP